MAGLADLLGLGQMVRPPGGMGGGQLNPQLMQALASLTGPGTPAAPAQAGPGMGGLDSQIEEQIRALSAPAPVVDEAVPKAPGTLQKILAALADAGSTYASGLNPYVGRTNASGALMDIGAQREGAIGRNAERRAGNLERSKKTEAELRLRELMGKRERALDETVRKAEDQKKADAVKEGRAYTEGLAKVARDQELADRTAADERAKAKQKADFAHDEAMVRLRASYEKGDKFSKDEIKNLQEAKSGANQIAANVQKLLNGYDKVDDKGIVIGKVPPQNAHQIRESYRMKVRALLSDKDAIEAAMAYFDSEVAPLLPNDESTYPVRVPGGPEIR